MNKISKEEFLQKAKKIKALVLDVDGVMTDGRIIYTSEGVEIKNFDVKDGYGIVMARNAGLSIAIVSGRDSKVTAIRAKDLKINLVYQGIHDKEVAIRDIVKKLDINLENVAFLGDDVIDIPIIKLVGIGAVVCDAHPKAKQCAIWVTEKNGGKGAVREFIDMIMDN